MSRKRTITKAQLTDAIQDVKNSPNKPRLRVDQVEGAGALLGVTGKTVYHTCKHYNIVWEAI